MVHLLLSFIFAYVVRVCVCVFTECYRMGRTWFDVIYFSFLLVTCTCIQSTSKNMKTFNEKKETRKIHRRTKATCGKMQIAWLKFINRKKSKQRYILRTAYIHHTHKERKLNPENVRGRRGIKENRPPPPLLPYKNIVCILELVHMQIHSHWSLVVVRAKCVNVFAVFSIDRLLHKIFTVNLHRAHLFLAPFTIHMYLFCFFRFHHTDSTYFHFSFIRSNHFGKNPILKIHLIEH